MKQIKIDANDPRWTAYALGELKDDRERAELEQILRESEEMRLMVEDIRLAAELLNDGLKNEFPTGLTETQRERIESQAAKGRGWFRARPAWVFPLAAAVLLGVVSIVIYRLPDNGAVAVKSQTSQPEALVAELRRESASAPVSESKTLLAELRNEALPAPASEPERMEPAKTAPVKSGPEMTEVKRRTPKVEIAPMSVTVEGETDDLPAASMEGAADPAGKDELLKANPSVGMLLTEKQLHELPLINSNALDVIKVRPGADITTLAGITADQLNIQRDGVTVNDLRYQQGLDAPYRLNPELIGDAKLVTSPVDAEKGRGSGQVQVVMKSGENGVVADADKPGSGGGMVSGVGYATGMPGGVAGGIPGGVLSESASVAAVRRRPEIYPPPPPPPPPPGRPHEERMLPPIPRDDFNTEGYDRVVDNPFLEAMQNPLSTFSIDVDTASYANVRRFLDGNALPPKDSVRIEEMVNYFDYDYKGPGKEGPFAAHLEMTAAPWNPEHRLLRIGLKAREMEGGKRPATNLVFLVDVSGSMADFNKLPLVQDSLHLLVDRLTETDHVAIVTYAGSTRVEIPSTRGDRKWDIHRAIDRLRSGGSTAGASGIQLAYETAQRNFIKGGANRVILATDGDFNVGITSRGDLTRLIEEKADSGVFLSALGYGMGNLKDDTLELLANKGRGNYAYIDTLNEAKKVLVEQINATLVSVAKDVKIQVEFNPSQVGAYRLIGYEDRIMAKEDFNNDAKKAGVIGAGHAVTALYEIVPPGMPIPSSGVDPLKYQQPVGTTRAATSGEVATVKIRYKEPEGEESRLLEFAVRDSDKRLENASQDFKFAASVAAFGMILRDSPYKGSVTMDDVLRWADAGKGSDRFGYRAEFIRLVHRAISLKH